jgi:collagenase-like PrtC family protease
MTEYFLAGLNGKSFEINLLIVDIWKKYPQYFNDDSKISAFFGGFDNCCWNGGRENRQNRSVQLSDCLKTIKQINDLGISVRFTFTNPLITEKEYDDYIGNTLMKFANNGMNGVIVANENFHNYLKEKYPNFHYVYSTTNCTTNGNIYNEMYDKYDILVLDYRLNKNKLFLEQQLKLKNKIEILVDDCCPSCKYRKQHFQNVGKYNLGEQIDISCLNPENYGKYENPKNFYESLLRTLENSLTYEEIEEYKKIGFNKFKLTGRSQGRRFLLDSYIYYFVKPQYRHEVRKILQQRVDFSLYDEK